MMTLSDIKREIRALQRKYHREIAIYRMRRVSDEIYNDYARAVGDQQDPPKPLEIIRRIADQGFRLTTWMHLHNYLDKVRESGDIPEPRRIVLALLPWAWKSKYDHYLTRGCRQNDSMVLDWCCESEREGWGYDGNASTPRHF